MELALLLGLLLITVQCVSTCIKREEEGVATARDYLAAVEQSEDVTGDYAQFEESTFNDLVDRRKLKEGLTWKQVKSNPLLYDSVVDTYWEDLTNTFGIPDDAATKAVWWLMPGRYKKTGGDISKIDNEGLRNIMMNRVKNLNTYLRKKGGD